MTRQIPHHKSAAGAEDRALYTADELRLMIGESPERLRALHQCKKDIDGEIVELS